MIRPLRRLLCGVLAVGLLCAACACGDDTYRPTEDTASTTSSEFPLLSEKTPYTGKAIAPLFTYTLRDVSWSGEQPLTIRPTTEQDPEELTYFYYAIVSPYVTPMDDQVISMLHSLTALYADAVIAHPTAEQLAQTGLNQPAVELDFRYTDDTAHHIAVGHTIDDTIAVQVDGDEAIYFVSAERYTDLFALTYGTAMNPYLFLVPIKTLQTISLHSADLSCDFQLQHYPDDTNPNTNLIVTMGDVVYPTDNFRCLYEIMLCMLRTGYGGVVPDVDPLLELTLGGTDGAVVRQVRFYANTDETAIAVFESGEIVTVNRRTVDNLLTQTERYLAGQPVIIK